MHNCMPHRNWRTGPDLGRPDENTDQIDTVTVESMARYIQRVDAAGASEVIR